MSTRQQGLTLIELMVTLAAAIILIAVGMPLFSGVAANNRATAQTNALVSAIKLARSEAVKRGANVSIAAVSSDWVNGWTVFVDANTNGAVDAGEGLRSWEAITVPPWVVLPGRRWSCSGATAPRTRTITSI